MPEPPLLLSEAPAGRPPPSSVSVPGKEGRKRLGGPALLRDPRLGRRGPGRGPGPRAQGSPAMPRGGGGRGPGADAAPSSEAPAPCPFPPKALPVRGGWGHRLGLAQLAALSWCGGCPCRHGWDQLHCSCSHPSPVWPRAESPLTRPSQPPGGGAAAAVIPLPTSRRPDAEGQRGRERPSPDTGHRPWAPCCSRAGTLQSLSLRVGTGRPAALRPGPPTPSPGRPEPCSWRSQ